MSHRPPRARTTTVSAPTLTPFARRNAGGTASKHTTCLCSAATSSVRRTTSVASSCTTSRRTRTGTGRQTAYDRPPCTPASTTLLTGADNDVSRRFLPVRMNHHMPQSDIPCTRGDAYGNETALFLQEAGFNQWPEIRNSHSTLGKRCSINMMKATAATLDFVAPYPVFFEEKVHWPMNGDDHRYFIERRSQALRRSQLRCQGLAGPR